MSSRIAPALAAAALAVPPAGAQAAWTSPQTATRSGIARSPSVDVDAAGRVAVAYVRSVSGVARVELRRGKLRDGLGGAPVLVARRADRPETTSVRFDGTSGSTLTAWDHGLDAGSSAVLSGPDGAPRRELGPFAGFAAPVVARAPDGTARVVLHGPAGLSVLQPGGERIDLSSAGRDARVAIGAAGEIVAAWTEGGRVRVAVAAPGGAFGPAVALASSSSAREPVLTEAGDGRVVIAWLAAVDGHTAVEVASRAPDGSFGATTTVVDPTSDARSPMLATAANGEALLVYLDTSGPSRAGFVGLDRGILRLLRMRPDGAAIGEPLRVSGPLERTSGAGVAVDAGGTRFVWGTTASVRARRVAPDGRRGRVQVLASSGVDGGGVPVVAGGPEGGGAAAWVSRGRVLVARSR